MRQRHVEPGAISTAQAAPMQSTGRRIGTAALVLTVVTTLLAGCIIVPIGYPSEHRRHHHRHW